ncbi:MAG: flagellar basal body rod protein FlgC [Candidatus Margulisiibacteriota bacterium]
MGLDRSLEISVSGIEAQRLAMELIASNLANINTTNTIDGGPYRRRVAILSEKVLPSFADELSAAENRLTTRGGGVEISDIQEDSTPFPKAYRPDHPDADAQGFVSLPNVNYATEMTDMVFTQRMFEANVTAFNATKKMMQDTLQLQ